ncbi:alpha/beta hydrolase family esterase [Corynebacterium comes]|uniref:alpha/beta hydrolase family esterase n=1 Tax=Corynebacterium comes TaxID=2675218 RepID=UPI0018CCEB0E|nr:alpha/beta fold hydrolase [Corynebacterium comes]
MSQTKYLCPVLVAVFTLIFSLGMISPAPASARSSLPGSSRVVPDATYSLAVGQRDVLVSLPADYDPAKAHPVLLTFGGWGVGPEEVARTTGLRAGSDAIIAYARGVDNAWAGAPYARTGLGEDTAYARAIVETIAARHPVDRARVYAIGHSNGGAFAMALACRAPDLVAGVVSVSGMFYHPIDEDCSGNGVPVMLIHAGNDDVAQIRGGVRHGAPFRSTYEIFDRWGTRNGCLSATTDRPRPAVDATHRVWLGCHTETELVVSESAGHQWPRHAPALARDFLSRQFG